MVHNGTFTSHIVTTLSLATDAEQRYRALLDSATGFAILLLAPDCEVIDYNMAAEEMLGAVMTRGSALSGEIERELAAARESGRFAHERWYERRDGTRFRADIVVTAVRDERGALTYYIVIIRDVTPRQNALDQLQERSLENAAVAAFAHKAVTGRQPEALDGAALAYLTATLHCDVAELHAVRDASFVLLRRSGVSADAPAGRGGIHSEALHRLAPVARRLGERDFEAAPYLRGRAEYGIATAVASGEHFLVLAAFSRDRMFETQSVYPLQAIASMHATAVVRYAAEEQIADRQNRLRLLLEQIPAVVSTLDHNLVFTSTQGSGLQAIGVQPATWIGKTLTEIVPEGSPPAVGARNALLGNASRNEYNFSGRTYENRFEPLRDREGNITGVVVLGIDITESRETEAALLESREQLRRLSASMNQIQEKERRRIAREIHDELGQRLTALRYDVGLLRTELQTARSVAAQQRIETMFGLIDETIATVRRVATELRPAILDDFGFRAAIEHELCTFAKRTGLATSVLFSPEDLTVQADRATALYRIVQEALTNVARHSGATHVRVSIEERGGRIHAELLDNGRGITDAEVNSRSTLGLVGVRERAYALGGDALIEGFPGAGTRVSVWIPNEDPGR